MPLLALSLIFLWMTILVAVTLLLNKKAHIPTFYTRKILHIGTAFVWIIGRMTVGNTWHMFIPNTLSFVAIAASYFFKPIEGIESADSDGKNRNYGTLYFAISTMLITACNFSDVLYPYAGLAFCALAFGDGFAAIFGKLAKKHNPKLCGNKTLVGLLTCFGVTAITAYLFDLTLDLNFSWLMILAVAGTVSIFELYTPYGLDNITIPLFATLLCYGMSLSVVPEAVLFVCAVSPFFAIIALLKKVFTPVAAATAFFVLVAFAWIDGYVWIINIFIGYGFVLGARLVRHAVLRKKLQDKNGEEEEKNGKSILQLAANLLVPLFLSVLYYYVHNKAIIVGALAAFASAISDSMASDIGVLQKSKPLDICTFKRVDAGVSGGISLLGTSMAVLTALVYSFICYTLIKLSLAATIIVGVSTLLGVMIDSMLGSLAQGKYKCEICGKQVEKPMCCHSDARLIHGLRFIDNNTVNIISNSGAAVIGIVTALILI